MQIYSVRRSAAKPVYVEPFSGYVQVNKVAEKRHAFEGPYQAGGTNLTAQWF